MAILNYTTEIPVEKTLAEIQTILVKAGASAVLNEYEAGEIVAVSFKVDVRGQEIGFRLPANIDAVYKVLVARKKYRGWNDEEKYRSSNTAQAHRVGWRIIKDWVEAQMALIQLEIASIDQVFLPYAVMRGGRTLYEHVKDTNLLLGGGDGN